jgi:DNA modification methylase
MWLACATQEEIAEAVGVPRQTIDDWTKDFAEMSKSDISAFPSGFEPPIYNVWKQQSKSNAVSHFGNSEARWVENLLYLYTDPAGIVVDPFGGGGSTIDVCKKWSRRYYVSDRKPIVAREHEIRLHDLTTGLPSVPRWKDVDLVYLDPPYWKQAEGQYSDDPTDLANMELEQFNTALAGIINGFAKKLKDSASDKPAYIALIIQPTQWKAPKRQFTDHIGDMLRAVKLSVDMRYSVPYESQLCTPQMVEWTKAAKRCLVLTREIIVWRVG